jgi:hypothetical protein
VIITSVDGISAAAAPTTFSQTRFLNAVQGLAFITVIAGNPQCDGRHIAWCPGPP